MALSTNVIRPQMSLMVGIGIMLMAGSLHLTDTNLHHVRGAAVQVQEVNHIGPTAKMSTGRLSKKVWITVPWNKRWKRNWDGLILRHTADTLEKIQEVLRRLQFTGKHLSLAVQNTRWKHHNQRWSMMVRWTRNSVFNKHCKLLLICSHCRVTEMSNSAYFDSWLHVVSCRASFSLFDPRLSHSYVRMCPLTVIMLHLLTNWRLLHSFYC